MSMELFCICEPVHLCYGVGLAGIAVIGISDGGQIHAYLK